MKPFFLYSIHIKKIMSGRLFSTLMYGKHTPAVTHGRWLCGGPRAMPTPPPAGYALAHNLYNRTVDAVRSSSAVSTGLTVGLVSFVVLMLVQRLRREDAVKT